MCQLVGSCGQKQAEESANRQRRADSLPRHREKTFLYEIIGKELRKKKSWRGIEIQEDFPEQQGKQQKGGEREKNNKERGRRLAVAIIATVGVVHEKSWGVSKHSSRGRVFFGGVRSEKKIVGREAGRGKPV